MTKQLTLISVPATPARQDAGAGTADVVDGARHPSRGPVAVPHLRPADATDDRADSISTPPAAPGAHRRSPGYTGWLDGRTISSGRKGVAAARAALADATQRVADREALAAADRQDRLERQARGAGRSDRHAA